MFDKNHNTAARPGSTRGELSKQGLRRLIAGVGFSRHACREKSPANPTASTKPPKHLGTLSDLMSRSERAKKSRFERAKKSRFERAKESRFERTERILILPALSAVEGSRATPARRGLPAVAGWRAKDLSGPTNVTSRCNVAPRTPRTQRAGRPTVSVFLVDTPVEIENCFSPSESTTSQNLSRYTFDMFGKSQKGGLSVAPASPACRGRDTQALSAPDLKIANHNSSACRERQVEELLAPATRLP
jgi:hypothetical protein